MSKAIIIGAGPAGLTAAYELLTRTEIVPIVMEMADYLGGISRTANYKGNLIDIGGHRFFSKSDRVMRWWLALMPMQRLPEGQTGWTRSLEVPFPGDLSDPESNDRVMLLRQRKSRIYFLRRFFDYPIKLSLDTSRKLGLARMTRIGASYLWAAFFPFKNPQNLEEFFINRFGRELYHTFFKAYTEKVWGEKCSTISADWGAQRIKGLSILEAAAHFVKRLSRRRNDYSQKDTETSLIEQFLYPKRGPGQFWETVAREVVHLGGEVLLGKRVIGMHREGDRITGVEVLDESTGGTSIHRGDYFFSTMPIKELIRAMAAEVPANVREVSEGLVYRDFITVGLLLNDLKVRDNGGGQGVPISDNWIYVQEPDVRVGRLQIFNNWSPYMVRDPSKIWIGLEYFCYENDDLWQKTDDALITLAREELVRIGFIEPSAVLDATVIRMPKTYPAYFGSYERFAEVREYLDGFQNLFLIGRNGMHRYNNQDHSMLTAMVAVDNIIAARQDKANIWAVNTEHDYHEKTE